MSDQPAKFEARPLLGSPSIWQVWDITHPAKCNHFPVLTVDTNGAGNDLHEEIAMVCASALNSRYVKSRPKQIAESANCSLPREVVRWLLEEVAPDLNNIVRASEDEGDRVYFGSSNDADDLAAIAQKLDRQRAKLTEALNNAQFAAAEVRGAAAERERIAVWLSHGAVPDHSDEGGCPFDKAAAMIRSGAHKETSDD